MTGPGVKTFVERQNYFTGQDPRRTHSSPTATAKEEGGPSFKSENITQDERHRRAEAARMPANGTTYRKVEQKSRVGDLKDLASAVAERPQSAASNQAFKQHTVFDDATEYGSTLSSVVSLGGNEQLMHFGTGYNRASDEMLQYVDPDRLDPDVRTYVANHALEPPGFVLGPNWRDEVEREKAYRHGSSRAPSTIGVDEEDSNFVHTPAYSHRGDDFEEGGIRQGDDSHAVPTPSRRQQIPMPPPPPPPPPPAPKMPHSSANLPNPIGKASSYTDASEDEDIQAQPASKKPRVELDYDARDLKALSYDGLVKQPFECNPRARAETSAVDEHGIPLTLQRKLGNMSRMKEADVQAMFSAQGDQEWEETGAWFMEQFGAQMKRILSMRHARRMVALKFEMEVRKRHAAVAAKTGDVEDELRLLRTGSKELLAGKPRQ